jgi:hypothetical protein
VAASTVLTFCGAESALVESLLPNSGPTAGGTVVTVAGQHFFANAWCKFGGQRGVAVTVTSSTELKCSSPATAASVVSLEIGNNNQDFTILLTQFTFFGMVKCCFVSCSALIMNAQTPSR